jgi:hypothetical protein
VLDLFGVLDRVARDPLLPHREAEQQIQLLSQPLGRVRPALPVRLVELLGEDRVDVLGRKAATGSSPYSSLNASSTCLRVRRQS